MLQTPAVSGKIHCAMFESVPGFRSDQRASAFSFQGSLLRSFRAAGDQESSSHPLVALADGEENLPRGDEETGHPLKPPIVACSLTDGVTL